VRQAYSRRRTPGTESLVTLPVRLREYA